jgi:ABC-type nitrate/sulfonate/bicarbonate transport system substrate-binding protein
MNRLYLFFILFLSLGLSGTALAENSKLRVYLNWFPSVDFAGMYAAEKLGWYKQNGLDIEFVFDGLNIVEQVESGKADIGMQSANDVIKNIDKGAKIKSFAAQYQLNPNSIVVSKNSPIKSVKDLKNKTLGYFTEQEFGIYKVILGHNGLSLSDIKLKKIETFKETELVELLKTGVVDGFIAWEFNWTVTFSLLGHDVRIFPGHENGLHFYGIVFFAPESVLNARQKDISKFVEVTTRAWREVYKKPEFWAEWIVENKMSPEQFINQSKSLTIKQQSIELRLRQKYFREGVGMEQIGQMSHYKWNLGIEIAKTHGVIPKESKLKSPEVFDPSVLRTVYPNKPGVNL